jgi:hypothetical protein
MTQTLSKIEELEIRPLVRGTLCVFTGTTWGYFLCMALMQMLQQRLGHIPFWFRAMVLDTNDQSTNVPEEFQQYVRVVPMGDVDLRAMADRPAIKPEVASTMESIPKERRPSSLTPGSSKVMALTLASFQATWLENLLPAFIDEVDALQANVFGVGVQGYQVFVTGLLAGGVGGIAPTLAASTLRTIGEDNPAFGRNLRITGVLVEPRIKDATPRILGNAGASLELLEAGWNGKVRIPVPRFNHRTTIGTDRSTFDDVFLINETSGMGKLGEDALREAVAEFLCFMATDPLGGMTPARVADLEHVKREVV